MSKRNMNRKPRILKRLTFSEVFVVGGGTTAAATKYQKLFLDKQQANYELKPLLVDNTKTVAWIP